MSVCNTHITFKISLKKFCLKRYHPLGTSRSTFNVIFVLFHFYLSNRFLSVQVHRTSLVCRLSASFLTAYSIHWGRNKMAAIPQTTFSYAFSWLKVYEFHLRFHWSLFLWFDLTISQHWFREWLGTDQATSHYLNQLWLVYWHIWVTRPQWVNLRLVLSLE